MVTGKLRGSPRESASGNVKSLEEVACLEQMNRVGDKAGKVMWGRQCLATNFLLSWSLAGVIAEWRQKQCSPT